MGETPGEQRMLTIRTAEAGSGRVCLQVADTGPGLSPEVVDRLFDPFVTTKRQGMGLGLSISSGIIEAHGGQLTVAFEPGAGATFTFTLPVRQPQAAAAPAATVGYAR